MLPQHFMAETLSPLSLSKSSSRRHQKVWRFLAILAATWCFFLSLSWQVRLSLFKQSAQVEVHDQSEERIIHTSGEYALKPVLNLHHVPVALASAFRDPRTTGVIVVHLITSNAVEMLTLYCHYRNGNETLYTANAQPPMSTQQYKPRYFTFLFHCPLWYPTVDHSITHVAISELHVDFGDHGVPVVNLHRQASSLQSLCVCVGPTTGWEFTKESVVAWIEMNRLLGVSHFIFYNHSIPGAQEDIFRYYRSLGIASVLHWRLHTSAEHKATHVQRVLRKLPLHHAINAYNDCLYRTATAFRYAAMLEPDELIIPYAHSRIDDLLEELDSKEKGYHAFKFNVVYLPSEGYQEPLVEQSEVYFLQKSKVLTFVDPDDQLPAFVVKPGDSSEIKDLAVHPHENTTGKMGIYHVNPKLATLRRYREFSEEMNHPECLISTDNRLPVYIGKLKNATSKILRDLKLKAKL